MKRILVAVVSILMLGAVSIASASSQFSIPKEKAGKTIWTAEVGK